MPADSTGIPPQIEQQLLVLDKQLRDAAFVQGFGRFVFAICVVLASCLLLDSWLDLNGSVRASLLIGWIIISSYLLWRFLVRPAFAPVSLFSLAALIEQQFPELRERLTSLVELRSDEATDLAPGASKLMQDLLARQTMKVFDRLELDRVPTARGAGRAVLSAILAASLLFCPFLFMPAGYGLLWSRFFIPWGNYAWGADWQLQVVEGNQVIARGSDLSLHVSVTSRWRDPQPGKIRDLPVWMNWSDEHGQSDSRRLEWDDDSNQWTTTVPRVQNSLTFHVASEGAKSESYRVDVSDPPAIASVRLSIEPAAYTGLPAKSLDAIEGEITVSELTQLQFSVEFREAVAKAELNWPAAAFEQDLRGQNVTIPGASKAHAIPMRLSADWRSATVTVVAGRSGSFAVHAENRFGLQNENRPHSLIVVADQAPVFQMNDRDQPLLVRPDDVIELPVDVIDDYGFSAVDLHVECSKDKTLVLSVPAQDRQTARVTHTFSLDLKQMDLGNSHVATWRFRAVDNRPQPGPQEVWTNFRSLVTNTTLKQLPDPDLANEEKSLDDELTHLRNELSNRKAEVAALHQQTEKEALGKQPDSDKSEQLERLQQSQDELVEKIERLSDRMAERSMTKDLAAKAQQIADDDLNVARDRLESSKGKAARDQLEPIAQAIDRMGDAERRLQRLEQELNELNKLEQDLAELLRLAQRAERLANELRQLESRQQDDKAAEELDRLKAEGQRLADQMDELLHAHPELVEAARRGQQEQLQRIADEAERLAQSQSRLSSAMADAAIQQPPRSEQPNAKSSPSDEEETQDKGQSAVQQQEQIARDALKQALDIARETGAQSDAAKAAADFAREADAAKQQAQSGQLQQAAQQATTAAQAADRSAQELNPDGESKSPRYQQAQKLAQQQRESAQRLSQLAQSPEAVKGAQVRGQRQIVEATDRLSEQLQSSAKAMNSAPLNSSDQAAASQKAKDALQDAKQSMRQSERENLENARQQSAQTAAQAAEKLQQAANLARPTQNEERQSLPVPKQIGAQVAQVSQKLETAQQQLSQCNCNNPGASGSKPAVEQSSSAAGAQPAASGGPGQKSDQQSPGPSNEVASASNPANNSTPNADSSQAGASKTGAADSSQADAAKTAASESGQSGQSGKPQASDQEEQAKASQFAQAADRFLEVAAQIRDARNAHSGKPVYGGSHKNPSSQQSNSAQSDSGQMDSQSEAGKMGANAGGANVTADLSELNMELQQQARRDWGRLPGKLRTEILQGSGKKTHPEYTQRIKSYFDEITKPSK